MQRRGHTFVPSSSVVPVDDPTLLFTNAGMNQFKDVFLGQGSRAYRRAANSQKCIRAGGKHNDLEDVGRDTYHHTFFEMLGNWSFGDYFKVDAITWAWELLTSREWWGIDPERLHVTVFGGDAADGLDADREAEEIWRSFVPAGRITRWGRRENFWEMGETGPCGPCSEIHYDATPDGSGGALVNRGDPRVIEIWNLVFMQFNRHANGRLTPLPAKHVDTGMGFERVTRVLQGKDSNYDTDIWSGLFDAIQRRSGARPYAGRIDDPVDIAYRVIADHARCIVVALADGAAPGNEGRSYVLRRILRRAVRMARQALEVPEPMLCDLVPAVVESLGEAFPAIASDPARIARIIADEEHAFLRTIDRGIALFGDAATRARALPTRTIAAEDAFRLHDTWGFPIDLTRVMAAEEDLLVDETGYERLMEEARDRSRTTSGGDTRAVLPPDVLADLAKRGIGPTVDTAKYATRPITARIRAIWTGETITQRAVLGDAVALILDRTNHYSESGGQVADHGTIRSGDSDPAAQDDPRVSGAPGGGIFRIEDVQSMGGYVLHVGRMTGGSLHAGASVEIEVDHDRRALVAANHTGTHLLNHALREVLTEHVEQKGSLVAPDRLRFDFTAGGALGADRIMEVERRILADIERAVPVATGAVPLAEARAIRGVRAVFGEKYPDPVRVVSVGARIEDLLARPQDDAWLEASIEFCGGTHVASTREIANFVVVSEQALAAGIRRIVAMTGPAATAARLAEANLEQQLVDCSRLGDDAFLPAFTELSAAFEGLGLGILARQRLGGRIDAMRERAKALQKRRQSEQRSDVVEQARRVAEAAAGAAIVSMIEGADRDALMVAMDALRARCPESAILLVAPDAAEGRVTIAASVPEALISKGLRAGDWVRAAAAACGGSGGGRPDRAQAGGKDPALAPEAIEAAKRLVARYIA